jgi:hypothetical protein
VQRAIGIPVNLFTAIFALARTVGWIAQLNEMIATPSTRSAARASCSPRGGHTGGFFLVRSFFSSRQ